MRRILQEVRAHFTAQRCIYCGTRQDRAPSTCYGRRVISVWHLYPDGTGPNMKASSATAQELADAADNDD